MSKLVPRIPKPPMSDSSPEISRPSAPHDTTSDEDVFFEPLNGVSGQACRHPHFALPGHPLPVRFHPDLSPQEVHLHPDAHSDGGYACNNAELMKQQRGWVSAGTRRESLTGTNRGDGTWQGPPGTRRGPNRREDSSSTQSITLPHPQHHKHPLPPLCAAPSWRW